MKIVIFDGNCKFFKYSRDVKGRMCDRKSAPSVRAAMALPDVSRPQGRMAKRRRKGKNCKRRQKLRRHSVKHWLVTVLARVFRSRQRRGACRRACLMAISRCLNGAFRIAVPAEKCFERAVRLPENNNISFKSSANAQEFDINNDEPHRIYSLSPPLYAGAEKAEQLDTVR